MTTYSKKQAPDKTHTVEVKHDLRKVHKRIYQEAKKVESHRQMLISDRIYHQVFGGFKINGVSTGEIIYGEAGYTSTGVRVWGATLDGSTPVLATTVTVTNLENSKTASITPSWSSGRMRGDITLALDEGDRFKVTFAADSTYDYNVNVGLLPDNTSLQTTVQAMEV